MLSAIDTNVISALWSKESAASGVEALLVKARREGGLVICAPVYAELLAYPGARPSFVSTFLETTGIQLDFALSERVWLEAGTAFAAYAARRRKGKAGQPKRLLIDFVIGAHALFEADRLLTLDAGRYRSAYPRLELVS